jgi:hypothetical protein
MKREHGSTYIHAHTHIHAFNVHILKDTWDWWKPTSPTWFSPQSSTDWMKVTPSFVFSENCTCMFFEGAYLALMILLSHSRSIVFVSKLVEIRSSIWSLRRFSKSLRLSLISANHHCLCFWQWVSAVIPVWVPWPLPGWLSSLTPHTASRSVAMDKVAPVLGGLASSGPRIWDLKAVGTLSDFDRVKI